MVKNKKNRDIKLISSMKKHLKSNSGDMYFQMLICLMSVIIIVAFSFNVVTVMTQKVWLDDKLNDITRIVAVTGSTKDDQIEKIEKEISAKMDRLDENKKGYLTFDCPKDGDWFNESKGEVQLNGIVEVNYTYDGYPAIEILNIEIPIDINLTKLAISERYYKPDGSSGG